MVARQLTAATHFPGQFSCKASGYGRAMLAPTRVFASLSPKYSCPPHGSLPHRLRAEPPRRGGQERAVPRAEFSPFVGNVIRRGAFYMRPRRFILPQAGTGGEGHVFPYCVCRGDHWSPANLPPQRIFRDSCLVRQAGTGEQCSPLQEFSPVWTRNIPARRTVLSPIACGRSPLAEGAKRGRCPARSFLPLSET